MGRSARATACQAVHVRRSDRSLLSSAMRRQMRIGHRNAATNNSTSVPLAFLVSYLVFFFALWVHIVVYSVMSGNKSGINTDVKCKL